MKELEEIARQFDVASNMGERAKAKWFKDHGVKLLDAIREYEKIRKASADLLHASDRTFLTRQSTFRVGEIGDAEAHESAMSENLRQALGEFTVLTLTPY